MGANSLDPVSERLADVTTGEKRNHKRRWEDDTVTEAARCACRRESTQS
jgi:hypothetical protein